VFGSVLAGTTGLLDKRFVVNALLPGLAFGAGLLLLATRGSRWTSAVDAWAGLTGFEQALVTGAAVALVTLFAFVAGGQVTALTKLWEGYWPRWLGPLAAWGRARERRRWDALDTTGDRDYARRYFRYPVRRADLLPTRLGNALRAAEAYPGDDERYGVDAVFFWPRLYLILPADARTAVDDARSALDRMVLLASLAAAYPLAALGVACWAGTPWQAWLAGAAVAAVVAAVAYRAAVRAATTFGDLVRASFDLYRRSLLTQLGLAPPAALADERALWKAIQQQLYRRAADQPELIVFTAPAEGQRTGEPAGDGEAG
jgi:hypothetical protein